MSARLLAFALAPMLESRVTEAPTAEVRAAPSDAESTGAVHDPANCPACLLLHTHVWQPGEAHLVPVTDAAPERAASANAHVPRSTEATGLHSRAPPILL